MNPKLLSLLSLLVHSPHLVHQQLQALCVVLFKSPFVVLDLILEWLPRINANFQRLPLSFTSLRVGS